MTQLTLSPSDPEEIIGIGVAQVTATVLDEDGNLIEFIGRRPTDDDDASPMGNLIIDGKRWVITGKTIRILVVNP